MLEKTEQSLRERLVVPLSVIAAALLIWNLYRIFYILPAEANVGGYKIIYFHVPAAFAALGGFFIALVGSALYLFTGKFKYDGFAAAVTEVALAFATINLVTGSIWARYAWGIWWTWDARLTSMLTCWLIYAGYLMLRRAIQEPTQRARLSAVLSIFGFVNVGFVYKSIEWYRTQHPSPVLGFRNGGGMAPGMEAPIYWNWLALLCLAVVLVISRMRQEAVSREIDSLRRLAHAH
jgi:heme exporter protein C